MSVFDWTDRRSPHTELDLIPLDRTKLPPSQVHGIKLENGGKPAFVVASCTTATRRTARISKRPAQRLGARLGLTGEVHGGDQGLYETPSTWLPKPGSSSATWQRPREARERCKKWISVSIRTDVDRAGASDPCTRRSFDRPCGMSDPTKPSPRPRHLLLRASTSPADGRQRSGDESFDLRATSRT